LELAAINAFEKPSAKDRAGSRVHLEKSGVEQILRLGENGWRPFNNDDIPS
jgi:hypothetical protein